jgi:hypothetical protein
VNCPTSAGVDPRPAGDRWSPAIRQPEVAVLQSAAQGRPGPAVARRPRVDACACGAVPNFLEFFFPALHFLCKWSTLAGWLQHMPTLPRLLLETSNTHNF